jgi:hypothetical protein
LIFKFFFEKFKSLNFAGNFSIKFWGQFYQNDYLECC